MTLTSRNRSRSCNS